MTQPRILVVGGEKERRAPVESVLRKAGYSVDGAGTAAQARAMLRREGYNLLVAGFGLPDADGLELLRRARAMDPDVEAVVVTASGRTPLAVEAVEQGAYDVLVKPFTRAELERCVERALEKQRLAAENRRLRMALSQAEGSRFVGESDAARKLMQVVEQVASSQATVLLTGEAGTGKELVAEAIHRLSPRRDATLAKVNCEVLPGTLLEAELFGHERGAFTGAVERCEGRFALAHGGTLFLDEVSALTPAVQAKLLRVLQDGVFEPLGSSRTVKVDVRLVAASSVDLAAEVSQGRLREDLFYRLSVITVTVPPLRERVDDIAPLARHFLRLYAARYGKHLDGISRQAMARLRHWRWPGNVRELELAIEQAVATAPGPTIELQHLPEAVRGVRSQDGTAADAPVVRVPIGTPLEDVERLLIRETLRQTGGNKRRAAHLLGIATRTIYRKL